MFENFDVINTEKDEGGIETEVKKKADNSKTGKKSFIS